MSFLRSFFGTCLGPYIFHDLRKHSWGRVIGHLVLLCLLCSIGIGIGNYFLVKYRWRAAYNSFSEVFGTNIRFSENGIIPEKNPEINRRQEMPYDTLLLYTPNGPDEEYLDETLQHRNLIIVWNQACLVVFTRQNGNLWTWVCHTPENTQEYSPEMISYPEMKEKMLEFAGMKLGDRKWVHMESFDDQMDSYRLFRLIRFGFACYRALSFFVISLVLSLFATGMFSLFFCVLTAKRKIFKFGELWKIAIYAAFPVIIVVNAFPALQLPGTSFYQYLFLIGWMGYLFYVLRYMILNPPAEKEEKTQGESDGNI